MEKKQVIKAWLVTDFRSFLGFSNYYRQFVPKYAQIAKPMNSLIPGYNASKKNEMIEWNKACQEAFDKWKELCTTAPVLHFVYYSKPFQCLHRC